MENKVYRVQGTMGLAVYSRKQADARRGASVEKWYIQWAFNGAGDTLGPYDSEIAALRAAELFLPSLASCRV